MNFFGMGAKLLKMDLRDYKIKTNLQQYPEEWRLNYLPPIKNQKSVGSCVAHAVSSILEYFNYIETGDEIKLSTDFIYGMQSILFNQQTPGMYLRDACKIVTKCGDCLKTTLPNNTEQPECGRILEQKLTDDIYKEALTYKTRSYAKCSDNNSIKFALMNCGPVLASMRYYDKNKVDGDIIIMDKTSDYGNHAIMIYGWNKQGWLCQNSWGKTWNKDGRFIIPYTDKLNEAWSFVDETNTNVSKPPRNSIFDIIYKIINFAINLIKKHD